MTTTQSMAKNAPADNANAIPASTLRAIPQVDPARVRIDREGFATRELFVRLPEGAIADDLKEPSLWSKVQKKISVSLMENDGLYGVSFDKTFGFEARVAMADGDGVTLTNLKIFPMVSRTGELPQDERYRLVWTGGGYRSQRKSDGHFMTQENGSLIGAEKEMKALWPQRTGGR